MIKNTLMSKVLLVSIILILSIFAVQLPAVENQETDKQSAAALIEKILTESGIDSAVKTFKDLRTSMSENVSFVERDFLSLGYRFLNAGKAEEAAAVLLMAAEIFPESVNTFIVLGQAYRRLGKDELDRKSVKQAFRIRSTQQKKEFLAEHENSLAKSASEVIQRHLDAIGGLERLKSLKTMMITYSGFNTINQQPLVKRYFKYPHFIRHEFQATGEISISDGKSAWRKTDKGWSDISQSAWKYSPDIYNDFVDFKKRGISYELLGVEAVDDHIYYHVVKAYADGEQRDLYFEAETGLFRMERRDFSIGKDIKSHWDYREINGVLIPHLFTVNIDIGFGRIHGGIITDIQVNVPIDDSLFQKSK
ncbi:hypothetical protein ACFLT9_06755 [Acidobacteriota bacterium]